MKIPKALLLSALALASILPEARAGDTSQQTALPQGYDLPAFTHSFPKTTIAVGQGKEAIDAPVQPSANPVDGNAPGTSVDWSAEVWTGVIYKGSRTK